MNDPSATGENRVRKGETWVQERGVQLSRVPTFLLTPSGLLVPQNMPLLNVDHTGMSKKEFDTWGKKEIPFHT